MVQDNRKALGRMQQLLLVLLIVVAAIASWAFVIWAFRLLLRSLNG